MCYQKCVTDRLAASCANVAVVFDVLIWRWYVCLLQTVTDPVVC